MAAQEIEDVDAVGPEADTFSPLRERVEQVTMLPVAEWPPEHAELVAEFVVLGDPRPAGSKSSIPAVRRDPNRPGHFIPILKDNGVPVVRTTDSSGEAGVAWRQEVASTGLHWRRFPAPLSGRLAAELTFITPYTSKDYSKRDQTTLLGSTRTAPHVRPDVLKLARAVEDALTKVLWEDDAQITDEMTRKLHVPPEQGPQRCEVRLWKLPTTWGELRELIEDEAPGVSALFGG